MQCSTNPVVLLDELHDVVRVFRQFAGDRALQVLREDLVDREGRSGHAEDHVDLVVEDGVVDLLQRRVVLLQALRVVALLVQVTASVVRLDDAAQLRDVGEGSRETGV